MTIYKTKGITYAEYVLDSLQYYFMDDKRFYIHVETFYNCREQGYLLRVNNEDKCDNIINLWIYNQRNSDEPTITWEKDTICRELFSENAWCNNTMTDENINNIVQKAIELIEKEINIEDDK